VDVARNALDLAIELLHQRGKYRKWSQIAARMEKLVHDAGYSVVEQFVGHGIGRAMHEEPQVPNFRARNWAKHDFWLDAGLVLAVEPMVNMGTKDVKLLDDHWTVVTADSKPSAHVEHTLALTPSGCEVLTDRSAFA
jgi:methionyl aminopeptidase